MLRSFAVSGIAVAVLVGSSALGCGVVLGLGDFEDAPAGGGGAPGAGGSGAGPASGTGGAVTCEPGAMADCYTADAATKDVGNCHSGTWTCNPAGDGFGPCMDEQGPTPETCATAFDDDCDGMVNEDGEGCDCRPGSTAACYSGTPGTEMHPPCKQGTQTCNDSGNGFGPCTGEVTPEVETCDMGLVDEDCDGELNEEGAGCVCSPNMTVDCYDGPAGTEDVGICKGGTNTCNQYGTGYTGACAGQVLPGTEVCTAPEDEDCSGLACSQPLHAVVYGEGSGMRIASDAAGNVIATGMVNGTVDFGGGPLISTAADVFVAKFDTSMGHVWSKLFGGPDVQEPRGIAVDASGNTYVAGRFKGTMTVGGTPYTSVGGFDVFLMKLDPSGVPVWTKTYGDASNQEARDVAVDGAGGVVITGFLAGAADFGAGTLTSAGSNDVFVVKVLGTTGATQWAKRYGDAGTQSSQAVAVDSSNNIFLCGGFDGSIDFGGGPWSSPVTQNVFLAKLDASGNHVWSEAWGQSTGDQIGIDLVVDAQGRPTIVGIFNGPFSVGGSTLTPSGTSFDLFLAQFSSGSLHLWSKSFPDPAVEQTAALGVDANGYVLLTGRYDQTLDFGGGPLTSLGNDVFVARFDPLGAHVWSKRFGDADYQSGLGIAADPTGAVLLTGEIKGTVDFGLGPLASPLIDVYIAKFAP